jgi:hypothetical protein
VGEALSLTVGQVRLTDLFDRASNGEKEHGRGGKESFGDMTPKTPEQERLERLRRERDRDNGRSH